MAHGPMYGGTAATFTAAHNYTTSAGSKVVFELIGSATKVVRVRRIVVSTIAAEAITIRRTSAAASTPTAITIAKHDTRNGSPAATAVANGFAADQNPGATVANVAKFNTAAGALTILDYDRSDAEPLILSGTSDILVIMPDNAETVYVTVTWTEETA